MQALQILQKCGLSQAACAEARLEMMSYRAGVGGYAVAGDYPDDIIMWWRCQELRHNHPMVLLVVRLYTITPHAGQSPTHKSFPSSL